MMSRRSLPVLLLVLSACSSSPSTGEEASSSSSSSSTGTPPDPDGGAGGSGGSGATWSALPLPATVDVGYEHTCAIVGDGLMKCWGGSPAGNVGGVFGDMAQLKPLDFGAPKRVLAIGLSFGWSCAHFEGGTVSCWGNNDHGQLGLGTYDNRDDVFGLPTIDLGAHAVVTQLSVGQSHVCALLDDHRVKCWGANLNGQLGVGDTKGRGGKPGELGDALPSVDLGAGAEVFQVVAGGEHTCALLRGGTVKCWGKNDHGQLGVGDKKNRGDGVGALGAALPAVDLGAGVAIQISSFGDHTCARLQDDSMTCWGENDQGQLGLGDDKDRGDAPGELGKALPRIDLAGRTIRAMSAATGYTCAVTSDGLLRCWGAQEFGDFGTGETGTGNHPGDMGAALVAVDLGSGETVVEVAAGIHHTCARLKSGALKCWGHNDHGQLGLDDGDDRGDTPSEMGDALPAVQIQ